MSHNSSRAKSYFVTKKINPTYSLSLIGEGDGGPGTRLIEAYVQYPNESICLCLNGEPTQYVLSSTINSTLFSDAINLIQNPILRSPAKILQS